MTLGQDEHQTRLEDIENENLISERRSSSDFSNAKSNSVSFTTSKPISPQLQFGFTPIKEYFTSSTESPNPSLNSLPNYQNRGQILFNSYQPQTAQRYQTQSYQQPQQQTYQYQIQPQRQNNQYPSQQPQNYNIQESNPVEYLQPQAQALQATQVVYQSEIGKADQYAQVVPQYSTLPQQYQSVTPSQVTQQKQQEFSQYSTFPQQQQDMQTYQNEQSSKSPAFQENQQLSQFNIVQQGKLTSQTVLPSKEVQYQQEALQYQDSIGSLQKPGGSNQVHVQDISSLQYLQPQLHGLEGVPYFGNGQVGSGFLNSFQDVFRLVKIKSKTLLEQILLLAANMYKFRLIKLNS
ncbi:probable serine/threonine-protein kinase fhkB [Agrilus planipennis]|nr:probable serine/threonine-protein kinase fhkB [Agrilus planipennis]